MNISTLQSAIRSFARSLILPVDKFGVLPCVKLTNARNIHITSNSMKRVRVGAELIRPKQEKATVLEGEQGVDLSYTSDSFSLFPEPSTETQIFNNIPYNLLHIVNIKTTPNNTTMSVTDYRGKGIIKHSAGIEGFKNSRKGTNVAAQQAANTVGLRAIERGITTVRVRIQGIGPGRMGSLKGLQLSGINIVSITDDTRVSWNPPRPRKQRRI